MVGSMIITPRLILHYVRNVTDVWAANEPRPPEDPYEYTRLILKMLNDAAARGERDALGLAIQYVLKHPEIDAGPLVSEVFPYSDEKARELLEIVLELSEAPSHPPGPSIDSLEWGDMPLEDWRRSR